MARMQRKLIELYVDWNNNANPRNLLDNDDSRWNIYK